MRHGLCKPERNRQQNRYRNAQQQHQIAERGWRGRGDPRRWPDADAPLRATVHDRLRHQIATVQPRHWLRRLQPCRCVADADLKSEHGVGEDRTENLARIDKADEQVSAFAAPTTRLNHQRSRRIVYDCDERRPLQVVRKIFGIRPQRPLHNRQIGGRNPSVRTAYPTVTISPDHRFKTGHVLRHLRHTRLPRAVGCVAVTSQATEVTLRNHQLTIHRRTSGERGDAAPIGQPRFFVPNQRPPHEQHGDQRPRPN